MSDIQTLPQNTSGKSQATQLSLFEPEEIVRPEYNIGKWAGVIFISPHAHNVADVRKFTFLTKNEGQEAEAQITITPMVGHKTPTTTTFKVYLALVQIWNQQGHPKNGLVSFSGRQLAAVAGWSWSGVIAKRIDEHLRILGGTNLDWSLTFKTPDGIQERFSQMHILDEISYLKREISFGDKKFSQNHWVRFNPGLVANMLNNLLRPINFKELVSIRSENSSNLYVLLDVFLANKKVWERNAYDLIYSDLGYTGKRYEARRERKRRLEEFKRDLDGRALVRGTLSIEIYENASGTDWKLVARKVPPKVSARTGGKRITDQETAEAYAQEIVEQIVRQPNPGNPRQGYIAWLALYVPRDLLFEALSTAKVDYNPANTRKSLTHVFIAIVKKLSADRGYKIPQKNET